MLFTPFPLSQTVTPSRTSSPFSSVTYFMDNPLVQWARGKYIAWDFTAIHTCAASYLHLSSSVPGGAAEHAADRKRNKCASLPARHEFVPIAVETFGLHQP